jgi:hypothetical protein
LTSITSSVLRGEVDVDGRVYAVFGREGRAPFSSGLCGRSMPCGGVMPSEPLTETQNTGCRWTMRNWTE